MTQPRSFRSLFIIHCSLFILLSGALLAQSPRVLIVTAHPDDESAFAASVYKITHDLKGHVDMAVVTNGEAGYKYSTLAEAIYGVELTDEKVGREYLPSIRKRETMAAGAVIGVRNFFFLDQVDNQYTLNVDSVFRHVWDIGYIKKRLGEIVARGNYDYIFTLLPTEETHGHHKGAAILALETVSGLDRSRRPIVLGGSVGRKGDTTVTRFAGLAGHPITSISSAAPSFTFDRSQKFGFRDRLDYNIVVNWLIAEHKSQGTMQMLMNAGDLEQFWYFDINDQARRAKTEELFRTLQVNRYPKKEY